MEEDDEDVIAWEVAVDSSINSEIISDTSEDFSECETTEDFFSENDSETAEVICSENDSEMAEDFCSEKLSETAEDVCSEKDMAEDFCSEKDSDTAEDLFENISETVEDSPETCMVSTTELFFTMDSFTDS